MITEHVYRRQDDGRRIPVTLYKDELDGQPVCGSIHGHYSTVAIVDIVNRLRAVDAGHAR